MYKATPRRSEDFALETQAARREWHNIFKLTEGKNVLPRVSYQANHSDVMESSKSLQTSKTKRVQHHQRALQEMLKELLQAHKKRPQLET